MNNNLSKIVSYILRHSPESYDLVLDKDGWIKIQVLLNAISKRHDEWKNLSLEQFVEYFGSNQNKRHTIRGGMIKANYGHSFGQRIEKKAISPPSTLYHGTNSIAILEIKLSGLKPMKRQYVHLSSNKKLAFEVAKRRTDHPIIIKINAQDAYQNGVKFYQEDGLWLSDRIPREHLNW